MTNRRTAKYRKSHRAYMKKYLLDPEKKARHLARVRRNNQRGQASKRALVDALKREACADCAHRFDPVCMDFDHVRGKKTYAIARLVGGNLGIRRLVEELAKCEMVCSNCHRLRTQARRTEK